MAKLTFYYVIERLLSVPTYLLMEVHSFFILKVIRLRIKERKKGKTRKEPKRD